MKTFNYKTNTKQFLGDLYTPVSIYLKLRDLYSTSVLMESSDYHAAENSYSFIAICPLASIGEYMARLLLGYPDRSVQTKAGLALIKRRMN